MNPSLTNKSSSGLITICFVLLFAYNIFYWLGKFYGICIAFYNEVKSLWFLFLILEFLGVASLLADTVVRWDTYSFLQKRIRISLTAAFALLFVLRFILGYMDLMLAGEVR